MSSAQVMDSLRSMMAATAAMHMALEHLQKGWVRAAHLWNRVHLLTAGAVQAGRAL